MTVVINYTAAGGGTGGGGGGGGGVWGAITGTLSAQSDLVAALAAASASSKPPILITASRALLTSDNGAVLYTPLTDTTGTYTLTVPTGLASFSCVILQQGTNPISCTNGAGVTMPVTGATAGANTAMSLTRSDATAEIYELLLPPQALTKASTGQAQAGTDDVVYMTPLKTAQAITALATSYAYVGLSTGTLPSSPTDGLIVKFTDTVWGGSGGSSGMGTEWIYIGAKSAYFPKNSIRIATINSTAGTIGAATGASQVLQATQLPAIVNKPSQRIKLDGLFGKTGTASVMVFTARIGSVSTTGQVAMASINLTAPQTKGYFQCDVMFDSTTSFHEEGGYSLAAAATTPILGTGLTAAAPLWIVPQFTPGTTDVPVLYQLSIELLPYGGV